MSFVIKILTVPAAGRSRWYEFARPPQRIMVHFIALIMQLLRKILRTLNGLHYPQEYLCLSKENFAQPLHVYLVAEQKIIREITGQHLFTGYNPLILVLPDIDETDEPPADITLILSIGTFLPNESFAPKAALATLSLQLVHMLAVDTGKLYFYEGKYGSHRFVHPFYQWIIDADNKLYNKKSGNVFLHDNLYKQVQIAYSIPRIISLITVGSGSRFNLFPTDLHGAVNDEYYVGSLRLGGKACRQVEECKKILITEINSAWYKTVYMLGKNHTQELKPKESFPFSASISPVFQLPVPLFALRCRELELINAFSHGIHRQLIFKIISSQQPDPTPATLAHLHNVYATWRHNHGLAGNYLLR